MRIQKRHDKVIKESTEEFLEIFREPYKNV